MTIAGMEQRGSLASKAGNRRVQVPDPLPICGIIPNKLSQEVYLDRAH